MRVIIGIGLLLTLMGCNKTLTKNSSSDFSSLPAQKPTVRATEKEPEKPSYKLGVDWVHVPVPYPAIKSSNGVNSSNSTPQTQATTQIPPQLISLLAPEPFATQYEPIVPQTIPTAVQGQSMTPKLDVGITRPAQNNPVPRSVNSQVIQQAPYQVQQPQPTIQHVQPVQSTYQQPTMVRAVEPRPTQALVNPQFSQNAQNAIQVQPTPNVQPAYRQINVDELKKRLDKVQEVLEQEQGN